MLVNITLKNLLPVACFLLCGKLMAQSLIIIPPAEPVAAGDLITVTAYFQSEQLQQPDALQPPDSLSVMLSAPEHRQQTEMQLLQAIAQELPAGVMQAQYQLQVPPGIPAGTIKLEVMFPAAPPAYLVAYQAPVEQQPSWDTLQLVSDEDNTDEDLTRNDFLGNIYAYQPTYFIAGIDPTDAKLQLSFKYRFINESSQLAERHEWLKGFYFAYTQLSLWDLSSESLPFEDTNFLPELFYQFNDVNLPLLNAASHADLQLGLLHESNGRDGDDSRSLNIAYIEPAMHFNLDDGYQLSLTPRLWAYVGSRSGNENIRTFRGNASLTATLGRRDGFQLEAYMRGNPGSGKGAVQLDFTYPLTRFTRETLGVYLHAQLFRGFGESLLDFDQRDTRFRIGLGLVR